MKECHGFKEKSTISLFNIAIRHIFMINLDIMEKLIFIYWIYWS